jgi:tripartite ATP-independent transporter DctM subunit
MNAAIIFGPAAGLMLTGMPISISLGLTVLTFLFMLYQVPLESVALKLFTGIEKFEIMAIPFFILAGNFLTHGGVARRMINFATSMVGHWYGGLGWPACWPAPCFAAVSGSSRRPRWWRSARSCCRRWSRRVSRTSFGAGVITTSGALGILIPPSIVMVMYSVATNTSVGALFMAGVIPGLAAGLRARRCHLVSGQEVQLPAHAQGQLGRALEGLPRIGLGPAADRRGDGRHLQRHVHADRGGGDERGVRLLRRGVRLQGHVA